MLGPATADAAPCPAGRRAAISGARRPDRP